MRAWRSRGCWRAFAPARFSLPIFLYDHIWTIHRSTKGTETFRASACSLRLRRRSRRTPAPAPPSQPPREMRTLKPHVSPYTPPGNNSWFLPRQARPFSSNRTASGSRAADKSDATGSNATRDGARSSTLRSERARSRRSSRDTESTSSVSRTGRSAISAFYVCGLSLVDGGCSGDVVRGSRPEGRKRTHASCQWCRRATRAYRGNACQAIIEPGRDGHGDENRERRNDSCDAKRLSLAGWMGSACRRGAQSGQRVRVWVPSARECESLGGRSEAGEKRARSASKNIPACSKTCWRGRTRRPRMACAATLAASSTSMSGRSSKKYSMKRHTGRQLAGKRRKKELTEADTRRIEAQHEQEALARFKETEISGRLRAI